LTLIGNFDFVFNFQEHCLMGIKGTVRRSTDANFIHTNIDIDLIISEEPEDGCPNKPEEIFHIIEHFCLGKRRLYLFGRDATIRPGWLTVGPDLSDTYFERDHFKSCFDVSQNGNLTGTSERIEILRPRTPPMKSKINQHQHGTLNSTNSFEPIQNNNSNNNAFNNSISNLYGTDTNISAIAEPDDHGKVNNDNQA
jgi:hypothetical protein